MVNGTILHPFYPNQVGAYMFMNYPQRLRLQRILDSVSQGRHAAGSIEQMVGDFYASGMDTITIDKRGYEPIKSKLAKLKSLTIFRL
jgi:putative endopeptidase